jgi:hypothetical protein
MQLQEKHGILQHKLQKIKERRCRHYLRLEHYSMKLDLLTNCTVVDDDDATRFVNENRTKGHYMSTWMIL